MIMSSVLFGVRAECVTVIITSFGLTAILLLSSGDRWLDKSYFVGTIVELVSSPDQRSNFVILVKDT
jgi:hypothetical protein